MRAQPGFETWSGKLRWQVEHRHPEIASRSGFDAVQCPLSA